MQAADFLDLSGQQESAREIAETVLQKAKAMDYAALIERAEKQLSGESLSSLVERTVRTRSEKEKVIDQIQESDESLRQNAAQILKIIELPSDRLPVLEREYFSYRDIAKEKMDWCRHIELIQDKRHELHPATHFKTDPTRLGKLAAEGARWRAEPHK